MRRLCSRLDGATRARHPPGWQAASRRHPYVTPVRHARRSGYAEMGGIQLDPRDGWPLTIAHVEERQGPRIAVLDALREVRPPFSPESATADLAALLRAYGISEVTGDRFAGEWPREAFRKHGVTYRLSEKPKSDLYRNALPAFNAGTVALLDHPRLVAQLGGLERRTSRGGRDSIDHSPRSHDDLANAVCGVLADLLVLAPGSEGGAFPLRGEALDLSSWGGSDPYNTGAFNWSELDAQDRRNRSRGS